MSDFHPLRPIIFLGALRTGVGGQIVNFTVHHGGEVLTVMVDDHPYPSAMPEDSDEILASVFSTVVLILDDLNRQRGDLEICNQPPAIIGFLCQRDWADLQTQAKALFHFRQGAAVASPSPVELKS